MTLTTPDGLEVVALWGGDTPNLTSRQVGEGSHSSGAALAMERNVTVPYLTVHPADPAIANGTAMVVCPGGALQILAVEHEGNDVARWLNARGVTAFVLRYRIAPTPADDAEFAAFMKAGAIDPDKMATITREQGPLAVEDGRQAIRIVRERADQWGIRPDRIGIIGFSAGAFVAGSVAMWHDEASRPDFAAPIYGAMWTEVSVPEDACPLFIALASNDELGPMIIEPCFTMYSAWQRAGHPVELHAYTRGSHGFGMIKQGLPVDTWTDRMADWLVDLGLVSPAGTSDL